MSLEEINMPHWVKWLAQDANGTWWGYQVEPLQNHIGWYENEVGQNIKLAVDKPNLDWQSTLIKITSTVQVQSDI